MFTVFVFSLLKKINDKLCVDLLKFIKNLSFYKNDKAIKDSFLLVSIFFFISY